MTTEVTSPATSSPASIEIRVAARSVYGATKLYPMNRPAEELAIIAGTKTLTVFTLYCAQRMGCKIVLDGDKTLEQLLAEV